MRLRTALIDMAIAAAIGCASTKERVGGATLTGAAAGVGSVFGTAWAAVAGFFGGLFFGGEAAGAGQAPPDPWQLVLGKQALWMIGAGVLALVILANRLEWFPDLFRRRSVPPGES